MTTQRSARSINFLEWISLLGILLIIIGIFSNETYNPQDSVLFSIGITAFGASVFIRNFESRRRDEVFWAVTGFLLAMTGIVLVLAFIY